MLLTLAKTVFVILQVLLIFNLMIIVHELGHFLAARWRGLVIEKFGIWFGKPLWLPCSGEMPFREEGADEMLRRALASGLLELDHSPERLSQCRFLVLIVGTP